MGIFKDEHSEENYFYCNANLRYPKETFLKIILKAFEEKEILSISTIYSFLSKEIKSPISIGSLKKLLGRRDKISKLRIENLIKILDGSLADKNYIFVDDLIISYKDLFRLFLQFFKIIKTNEVKGWILVGWVEEKTQIKFNYKEIRDRILGEKNEVNLSFIQRQYKNYYGIDLNLDLQEVNDEDLEISDELKSQIARKKNIVKTMEDIVQEQVDVKQEQSDIYYCSKNIKFPKAEVIESIYDLFVEKNVNRISFEDIYRHLSEKYNVPSFNRTNLANLLNANYSVSFSYVKDLYKKTKTNQGNESYDYRLVHFLLVDNRNKFLKIVNSLGVDFLAKMLVGKLRTIVNYVNLINVFVNGGNFITELKDKNCKLFDKNNSKMLSELLLAYSDDEWIAILKDQQRTIEIIDEFIERKGLEEEKAAFKKRILMQVEKVHSDNLKARVKYLFPTNVSEILNKAKLFSIEDLKNIDKKTSLELFPYKKIVMDVLVMLQESLISYFSEKFMQFLQMRNKNGRPNTNWEKWVAIIEKRAEGLNLVEVGQIFGITREGIRQVDRKYIDAFSGFYSNGTDFNNILKTFVQNDVLITNEDISNVVAMYPNIFKYLLNSAEIDGVEYIKEIDKFYFTDDFDWYKELVTYGEQMPEKFDEDKASLYTNEALDIIKEHGIDISYDDCNKVLLQGYRRFGNLYSRSFLTKVQKFRNVIKTFYSVPVNIYDKKFLREFRQHFTELYNDDYSYTDHAISSILAQIGVLVGRGVYVLNDRMFMSQKLADKIYNYIIESEREIFLTNNLYAIFEEELIAEGINNKYFLQGALKQRLGDKLYFKRDYIGTSKETTSIYGEVYKFIKESGKLITYEELQDEFVGIPWNVLIFAVGQEGILNYRSKYIHVDNIELTDEDKIFLRNTISTFISDGNIHHTDDLLAYFRLVNPKLLNKMMVENRFALFSVLECLFNDEFEFKRPFIAQNGVEIENQYDRIREFVESEDEISIDSILDYIYDNKLHLGSISEFIDSLDNYVFKDDATIISLSKTNLNKYNVEILEKVVFNMMSESDFIFADALKIYKILPKEVNWTPWLLYSALNKFGTILKAIPSNTMFRRNKSTLARPLIIRRSVPAKNISEYIEYLKQKLQLNDIEFYKYLRLKGLAD